MATLAGPRARAAAAPRAKAAPSARRWAGLAPGGAEALQAKLEVGPSHDRFEAEADRVAASVAGTRAGPATPPAISPLAAAGASRKPLQREEARPIQQREKQQQPETRELTDLLQRKPAPQPGKEEEKAANKPTTTLRRKADPKPTPKKEEEKVQKKAAPGPLLRKADPKPTPKKEEEKVQKKALPGTLQRDSVDDDTVLETSIQAKPLPGALQREVVAAEAVLETEEAAEEEKAEPVQRAAESGAGFTAPTTVESGIASMRGHGEPLAPDVRGDLEPRFGRDLSNVRVHSGARAGELSNAVHARAFTVGEDVFFGAGQYQPSTGAGRTLLAHELTHTIQQGGGSSRAQPARIQRTGNANPPPPGGAGATATTTTPAGQTTAAPDQVVVFRHPKGELHVSSTRRVIKMRQLPLPMLGGRQGAERAPKGSGSYASPRISVGTPWAYLGRRTRGNVTARQQWLSAMATSDGTRAAKIERMPNVASSEITGTGGAKIAYLRPRNPRGSGQNFLLIGTPQNLACSDDVRLPTWADNGEGALFDVDHVQELQLGGVDGISNFWLLDQGTNRSCGNRIKDEMRGDFDAVVSAALSSQTPQGQGSSPPGASSGNWFTRNGVAQPNWDHIRADKTTQGTGAAAAGTTPAWDVEYLGVRNIQVSGTGAHWTKTDIEQGNHLDKLSALTSAEIRERGLQYAIGTNRVTARIYTQRSGGFFRTIRFGPGQPVRTTDNVPDGAAGTGSGVSGNQFYKGFAVAAGGIAMATAPPGPDGTVRTLLGNAELSPEDIIATIHGQPFPASGKIDKPPFDIAVRWRPEFGFGGYADRSWINERMARLTIRGASTIEVTESGLTPQGELFANGEIVATKLLFPGLRIPIYLRGDSIFVSFPIPYQRLNFGPVHATEASIDMGFDRRGLFLAGRVGVKVDGVGSGTITATANTDDTILAGDFNFDLDFLNPASAGFRYSMKDDMLTLTLRASVREGVLPGVSSGTVAGSFSRDAIELSGTLNLAPPLAGSTITLGYDRTNGLTIAADNIPLPISRIPGIQDATLSARASYNPDDGQWRLSGSGRARFSVPPVSGELTVALNGRLLTINGTASFQQGIAAGSVTVNVTNAAVDEAGQPVPDQVSDRFTITGRGSASLQFGILRGTAAIALRPDGHAIVDGEIALPPTHPVFGRRNLTRELLHVASPDIPIWGISIAGYGIGIFAFFDARLSFDAFIGPGTLQNTAVRVRFDLERPQDAVVDGTATFVVPAGAGLTLDVGGGLRARLAIAYVQGRIGLDARLGLTAEARANVTLHWSQAEGLSLTATAHAEAQPRFEVGVNASVTAGVDLGLFDVDRTWGPWRRRLGSFGPQLAVGVTVPIAWSERAGLDFSADRIEITRPEIDFGALMKDAFLQLV